MRIYHGAYCPGCFDPTSDKSWLHRWCTVRELIHGEYAESVVTNGWKITGERGATPVINSTLFILFGEAPKIDLAESEPDLEPSSPAVKSQSSAGAEDESGSGYSVGIYDQSESEEDETRDTAPAEEALLDERGEWKDMYD